MTETMLDREVIEAYWRGRIDEFDRQQTRLPRPVRPCPCACNQGGFCGGCGHAGCGGRRP